MPEQTLDVELLCWSLRDQAGADEFYVKKLPADDATAIAWRNRVAQFRALASALPGLVAKAKERDELMAALGAVRRPAAASQAEETRTNG